LAGRAALFNEPLILNPDSIEKMTPSFKALLHTEGFKGYMAMPVMASEKVKGVIELMDEDAIALHPDEMQYLRIACNLGGMTISKAENRIAIENAKFDLEKAYGETLEAWVRAMELRDKYTAGHNQRVTEMSLRLAAKLGISNEMLLHITRGALLHDIGKLAISDKILLKTGPLDDKERKIIRQHPKFAYQLLKPIKYLEHAIDIPYCHHEMWNGEGYPQGLKEEEIPLNARIFSVVDVWDALITDRPYREAWPKEEALDYIEAKSGIEFDPMIVDAFIEIINSEGTGPVGVEKNICSRV
jgi:HD-GYP domain-containing protein (c-di-GMP phosphodiesterase class II)